MSQLALYFLGTPHLERDGVSITLSHHKATALLAYLAVTRQPHTRQALATLLWPDHDAANGRAGVRRMLWVLNKSLGQAWLEADHETVLLPSRPGLWLDVERFRALLANRRQHGHALSELCPACLAPLTEAVALVRGDFMAGFTLADSPDFDSWQAFETESLRRELAGALEQLVQLLSRSDDTYEPAISYARRRLALDPLHEPAHRQLMQIYAWAGQAAAALQQYQSCVRVLEQELGIAPSTETTLLAEAIKANRLPPPPGSLGPAPVAVTASAQPVAATAPAPPAAGPPHNLPVLATPFIGRKAALDNLEQRLAAPDVRLMTIVGPGGIGKTRLALALAERYIQSPQFSTLCADGIYFIPLTPLRSDQAIVQAIAEGLALPLTAAGEPATQLLTYLRHKQMLLILDNFEHILTGAPLVGHILQTAGSVKIVVTSQERLNLTEENLWQIGGLNFAGLTGVEEALAYEAVQLFIQRARQVRPDFTLQAEDLPYLERILQGVWGMPLAIELAAAWLNMLSLAGVAGELSHGLDLLESELRDVPDRHRSMRLVFDHSWQRLAEAEQTLLKKLSVFRGGFSREAAQQVAGASLRLLAGLVNKSWLISRPDSSRYELHELIRQYAATRLQAEPKEDQATRDRHSRYYLTLLQGHETDMKSSRQKETVAGLNADIDNIRSAWDTAIADEALDRLHTAAYPLWYFYNLRDSLQEGEQVFESATERLQTQLAASESDQAAPDRARLAGTLGELLSHQAQFTFRQG
ncbi:MAG: AAA family ATPase, partial [Anaerolineae bacterium]|nr:AAA family ATPase [Anaerolineae bacterium]